MPILNTFWEQTIDNNIKNVQAVYFIMHMIPLVRNCMKISWGFGVHGKIIQHKNV